jgi:hypothetical protein
MANLGRYCKAYIVSELRRFPGWLEAPTGDGQARADDAIVFVQEDLSVTDGLAVDEQIVYRSGDPAWSQFCRETLAFELPAWCATS